MCNSYSRKYLRLARWFSGVITPVWLMGCAAQQQEYATGRGAQADTSHVPAAVHELPDLTIIEPKIPAYIAVEGGQSQVTAVGAEGRYVTGVVARPIPEPEITPEERAILGLPPERKSYYQALLDLYSPPRYADEGVYPGPGLQIGSSGLAAQWRAHGIAPPVYRVGPVHTEDGNPYQGPVRPWGVGHASTPVMRIGPDRGIAETAENEPRHIAKSRDRVR